MGKKGGKTNGEIGDSDNNSSSSTGNDDNGDGNFLAWIELDWARRSRVFVETTMAPSILGVTNKWWNFLALSSMRGNNVCMM